VLASIRASTSSAAGRGRIVGMPVAGYLTRPSSGGLPWEGRLARHTASKLLSRACRGCSGDDEALRRIFDLGHAVLIQGNSSSCEKRCGLQSFGPQRAIRLDSTGSLLGYGAAFTSSCRSSSATWAPTAPCAGVDARTLLLDCQLFTIGGSSKRPRTPAAIATAA
jgi:hypothetical protein